MGGRGGAGKIAYSEKQQSRFSSLKEEKMDQKPEQKTKTTAFSPADFVKAQTGIDLEKYRDNTTRRFDKRGIITVDWKAMPETAKRQIELLANKRYENNIEIVFSGTWMAQIKKKKK